MKKLFVFYNVLSLPAFMFHECSHIVMILILRGKFYGYMMEFYCRNAYNSDASLKHSASVFHSGSNPVSNILISLAPVLFFLALLVYSFASSHYLIYAYCWAYAKCFWLSKRDWDNILDYVFLGYPSDIITASELTKVLENKMTSKESQ